MSAGASKLLSLYSLLFSSLQPVLNGDKRMVFSKYKFDITTWLKTLWGLSITLNIKAKDLPAQEAPL